MLTLLSCDVKMCVTYSSCSIVRLFPQHCPQVLCSHLKFVYVVINSGTA